MHIQGTEPPSPIGVLSTPFSSQGSLFHVWSVTSDPHTEKFKGVTPEGISLSLPQLSTYSLSTFLV